MKVAIRDADRLKRLCLLHHVHLFVSQGCLRAETGQAMHQVWKSANASRATAAPLDKEHVGCAPRVPSLLEAPWMTASRVALGTQVLLVLKARSSAAAYPTNAQQGRLHHLTQSLRQSVAAGQGGEVRTAAAGLELQRQGC